MQSISLLFKKITQKRTLVILILALLTIATFLTVYLVQQRQEIRKKAAPLTSIYFDPSTKQAAIGETVELGILVNTQQNTLYSGLLEILYDPQILEVQSLTSTNLFPDILRSPTISYGKVSISAGTGIKGGVANPPVSGTKKIGTITLKVLKSSTGTQVSFSPQTAAYTGTGTDIGVNLIKSRTSATIIASAPTSTPTQTPTPRPTATPTPKPTATPTLRPTNTPTPKPTATPTPKLTVTPTSTPTPTPTLPLTPPATPTLPYCPKKALGDANCDNKIDGIDYSIWLNHQCHPAANQECVDYSADFNQDGNVDDDDFDIWNENSE